MIANATGTEKYTFTGQFIEADIGLYYFGARWYDASLGRFISEDPIKGSMLSSQSQNPYVYCMNNPLRYVDPTGMMTVEHIVVNGHDVTLIDGHPAEYWSGSGSRGESMFDRVAQEHYDRVSRGKYTSGEYYTHGDFGTDSWGVNIVYHTDNTLRDISGHNFTDLNGPYNTLLCSPFTDCSRTGCVPSALPLPTSFQRGMQKIDRFLEWSETPMGYRYTGGAIFTIGAVVVAIGFVGCGTVIGAPAAIILAKIGAD